MKTFTDEQLCNSPTLQKLSVLSRVDAININDCAEVNSALASSLVFLVDALDREEIHFNDQSGKSALWQMLLVCHSLVTQPKPESKTQH